MELETYGYTAAPTQTFTAVFLGIAEMRKQPRCPFRRWTGDYGTSGNGILFSAKKKWTMKLGKDKQES